MLKEERLETILSMLAKNEIIKVSDITDRLRVTEMTVRRDLQTLEEQGLLRRVHGGAKRKDTLKDKEFSHLEKQQIHLEEKKKIAKTIANLISEGDIVFLGPGTTIEYVYDYLSVSFAKIITNSIHVFNRFIGDDRFDLILIGGAYRSRTGAFVGSFANKTLNDIRVKKAFVGTNGVFQNNVTTSNEDEGEVQSLILDNAYEKYIVADHHKLDHEDFYRFYHLDIVTALITDDGVASEIKEIYENYTKIITK